MGAAEAPRIPDNAMIADTAYEKNETILEGIFCRPREWGRGRVEPSKGSDIERRTDHTKDRQARREPGVVLRSKMGIPTQRTRLFIHCVLEKISPWRAQNDGRDLGRGGRQNLRWWIAVPSSKSRPELRTTPYSRGQQGAERLDERANFTIHEDLAADVGHIDMRSKSNAEGMIL